MLELRNIVKTYRSKKGETVCALDDLSLTFPERGMVIILGKSGSGKSTLLNVIGGLDASDSGEFVIRGKSSKDFAGSDFDSYRNTFVGFIFQEYNVLDDFSVGANIGLALELQGKRATSERITDILSRVDLLGFASRKPNELSGGQKQRVAIARALVKDPEIIMADEPTGALDSATGKAIFDVLKELSREKLVIVVSHDREFAEKYADRIIELSDGRVLSDVSRTVVNGEAISAGLHRVSDDLFRVRAGYTLTEEDLQQINAYLASRREDIYLSGDHRVNENIRLSAGVTDGGDSSVFSVTKEEGKTYDGSKTTFIPSRLPIKNAVRIGASGLRHKRIRLIFTIFLSLIAFTLFGVADTMAAYNRYAAAENSILNSHIPSASFRLEIACRYTDDDPSETFYIRERMNDADVQELSEKTGLSFIPVYAEQPYYFWDLGWDSDALGDLPYYRMRIAGIVALDEKTLTSSGLTLYGRMPQNENEIVLPRLICEELNLSGFKKEGMEEHIPKGSLVYQTEGENSIIGKHMPLPVGGGDPKDFLVVGVLDTAFDYARYAPLIDDDRETASGGLDLAGLLLSSEMYDELQCGLHELAVVSADVMRQIEISDEKNYYKMNPEYETAEHESGIYSFAIAPMPHDRATVRKLVSLNYKDENVAFRLQNPVMSTLNTFDTLISMLAKVFIWIGVFHAIFASLLLMNFISVSISYKKREIGILRAVGARSSDVFKIFWSEATIIALINFVGSMIATIAIVGAINASMAEKGVNVTLLHFGIRQFLMMLAISVGVALLSSFLPVFHIARKKPVDAIKNL